MIYHALQARCTLLAPHSSLDMAAVIESAVPLVLPRDDLTIPQFFLDEPAAHFTRPARPAGVPVVVDELSGKALHLHELRSRSHALARALRGRWNIQAGDVVSVYAPNHIDYATVVWAIHRLGAIAATHNPSLTSEELLHQLKIARPTVLFAHPDNVPIALDTIGQLGLSRSQLVLLEDASAARDASALPTVHSLIHDSEHDRFAPYVEHRFEAGEARTAVAFLCFSSGTTGLPKAVSISHYNVICNVVQTATFNRIHEPYAPWEDRRFRPGDICSGVLPLYHIYGLVTNLHFSLYAGMSVVVTKKFNYETFLRSIARFRITHLMIVPPQAVLFCKHPLTKNFDLSSVRYCMVAAAPVSAELTEELLQVFPGVQLGQGYGMTETCASVSLFPVSAKVGALGSGGQLVPGTTVKIVKPDGTLAPIGEAGELYVRGPQVVLGYYRNEEATKEAFVDGWMRTGDEALFHANGDLFITDRIKELIKVKGNQVAPSELEGRLLTHPDVADAAVIAVPDAYAGELPYAYVVLKPGRAATPSTRAALYKYVAAAASRYKWLDGGIEFVDAVPKNASGKILRRMLRSRSRDPAASRAGLNADGSARARL